MSEIICGGCGRKTITSMSRSLIGIRESDYCLVAWDPDKNIPVIGCGYEKSDPEDQLLAIWYLRSYKISYEREHGAIMDDYISERTLKMMDEAARNLKEGKAGEPLDTDEMRRIAELIDE